MTDKKTEPEKTVGEPEEATDGAEVRQVETEMSQIEADLEKARLEAADYLDSLQRLKAEFENFKKRMLKEQTDFLRMASAQLVEQVLPVLDNFERALAAGDVNGAVSGDVHRGFRLVYEQLNDVLCKEGLCVIDPLGEHFDPLKHEAMMQDPTDQAAEDSVTGVFEKGYEFKGRVIRPARVKVAKPANEP